MFVFVVLTTSHLSAHHFNNTLFFFSLKRIDSQVYLLTLMAVFYSITSGVEADHARIVATAIGQLDPKEANRRSIAFQTTLIVSMSIVVLSFLIKIDTRLQIDDYFWDQADFTQWTGHYAQLLLIMMVIFQFLLPNSLKSVYLSAFRAVGSVHSSHLRSLELKMHLLMIVTVFMSSALLFWMILHEATVAVLLAKVFFELFLAFMYHNELISMKWAESAKLAQTSILLDLKTTHGSQSDSDYSLI